MALVTIDQARARCGLADGDFSKDAIIKEIIAAAEEYAKSACHRIWAEEDLVDEFQCGDGTNLLLLNRYPVQSIAEIRVDDQRKFSLSTALAVWDPVSGTGDYMISDSQSGAVLMMPTCQWGVWPSDPNTIKASYTAGYDAGLVPATIIEGILELVKVVYEGETSAPNEAVDSLKVGNVTFKYRDYLKTSKDERVRAVVKSWFAPYMMGVIG